MPTPACRRFAYDTRPGHVCVIGATLCLTPSPRSSARSHHTMVLSIAACALARPAVSAAAHAPCIAYFRLHNDHDAIFVTIGGAHRARWSCAHVPGAASTRRIAACRRDPAADSAPTRARHRANRAGRGDTVRVAAAHPMHTPCAPDASTACARATARFGPMAEHSRSSRRRPAAACQRRQVPGPH